VADVDLVPIVSEFVVVSLLRLAWFIFLNGIHLVMVFEMNQIKNLGNLQFPFDCLQLYPQSCFSILELFPLSVPIRVEVKIKLEA